MFSFFKKKKPEAETPVAAEPAVQAPAATVQPDDAQPEAAEQPGFLRRLFGGGDDVPAAPEAEAPPVEAAPSVYEGQLFPETAERPVSEAEAKRPGHCHSGDGQAGRCRFRRLLLVRPMPSCGRN